MIRSLLLQAENVLAQILAATQVTCLFGFIAWLGATSAAWGLGFTAIGVAIDLWRWFYRYDWDIKTFVRHDNSPQHYLAQINCLLTDDEAARRVSRHYRRAIWIWCVSWVALLLPISVVNSIWGDEPFCANEQALAMFDFVAAQLIENVRDHPRQLTDAGYSCRAAFVAFYYAAFYYLLIIGLSFYFILISHLDALNAPVQAVRKRRVQSLEKIVYVAKSWRGVLLTSFPYLIIFFLSSFAQMRFKDTSRTWNVHTSNFQAIVMIGYGLGILACFTIANYSYSLGRARSYFLANLSARNVHTDEKEKSWQM